MQDIVRKVKTTLKYYFDKRFSTIAGTLVYFLIMSITPFMLWLTLAFGNVDVGRFLDHRFLDGVSPFLKYLKRSAESAASGAGLLFLATSLYSSSNFFYHLRRSGEIIYESANLKSGLKLRIMSLLLIVAAIILVALTAGISVIGTAVLNRFMPDVVSEALSSVFMTVLMFITAVILNIFACPYKMKPGEAVTGSLLTTALWLVLTIGFAVYMNFASPERLYGKIASVIIFLLWCYVMMSCFVVGMINNGRFKRPSAFKGSALPLKK